MTQRSPGSAQPPLSRHESGADDEFDTVYSEWIRSHSERHWTPVEVATRAADLLVANASTRVLDVGSGPGKFCIVAALTTRHGHFYGIEQRTDLVRAAREAAGRCGVEPRVHFIHGDITSIDWREFTAFYFFNPFAEPIEEPADAGFSRREGVEAALPLREYYLRFARAQLAAAPSGTRVVTYHGLGGQLPPVYECIHREACGTDFVELWVNRPSGAWLPSFDPEADEWKRDGSGAGAQW